MLPGVTVAFLTDHLIQNWMRGRNTIEFLGIWEQIHNRDFNPLEFEGIKIKAGRIQL